MTVSSTTGVSLGNLVTIETNPLTGVIELSSGMKQFPNSCVPIGLMPSATWNDTAGGFTLGTALPHTYTEGIYCYFSGVGVNGSTGGPSVSGFYFCVFSSTTVGVAYGPVFNPTLYINPKRPDSPANLNTTVGTHVPTTAAFVNTLIQNIPGGLMGPNGVLYYDDLIGVSNTVNTKSSVVSIGGTTIMSNNAGGVLSNTNTVRRFARFYNGGLENVNFSQANGYFTVIAAPVARSTINTAVDQQLTTALRIDNAIDFIIIYNSTCKVESL